MIEKAYTIGLSYNELLSMDIRKFNSCINGFITQREIRMNDDKTVGHLVAAKIAQAVWSDKQFKKPIKEIKLREEEKTSETRNAKVIETLRKRFGLID